MKLSNLLLTNFRNFEKFNISFDEGKDIHCIIGPNTIGKTNLLESIYFLGLLKSFRTTHIENIIKWETSYLEVKGEFVDEFSPDKKTLQINMVSEPRRQCKYRINDLQYSLSDYLGNLNIVFFSPDDINLLLLSPANRRRYLDILLSQTDKRYLINFIEYKKVLQNRNALLRAIQKKRSTISELEYWDEELVQYGFEIFEARRNLIDFLNNIIAEKYKNISNNENNFQLQYVPSFKEVTFTKTNYYEKLKNRIPRDLMLESTTIGPHRDDFDFLLEDKPIETFASRGDTRSMILALKLCEIDYIKKIKNAVPILLLDDVFSELDENRQEQLINTIPKNIQTFITSTEPISLKTNSINYITLTLSPKAT